MRVAGEVARGLNLKSNADGVPETGQTVMSDFWINGRRAVSRELIVESWG